ncbi:MAG: TlpA family protein disulfide reductase [Nitrospiraceae bacterium]|jgi:peroxiredoxin|nr:MAG: TlpA family protein disulfide reductase [Nitrospiraceae bacterium]
MGSFVKKYTSVIFCLLACLLLFSCNSNDTKVNATARIGGLAPDFSLKDITGSTINLSEFENKVVLLEFWATWCPPCKASIPELMELQERYKARGFTVISISIDKTQELSKHLFDFSQSYHINYPVLIGNEAVSMQYNVTSIPASFLIDKKGRIVSAYIGFTDNLKDDISTQIEKII